MSIWLDNLQKAIVLQEIDTIDLLLDCMPTFKLSEDAKNAQCLLAEVKTLLENNRSTTLKSLNQLKNGIEFLKATQNNPASSINFKL